MIKRDTIQRCVLTPVLDEQGGNAAPEKEMKEIVRAHVSQTTTFNDLQYGYADQVVLHCTTGIELDTSNYARYIYADRMFKVMRQVKQGNEYFSVLLEVNE